MDLKKYLDKNKRLIDKRLDAYLPRETAHPRVVHKAMRYMVMSPGKRFRPILVLEACRASGGTVNDAVPAACAIEIIHTYSLIHDDLPSMDDADMRRGRQSCHKKFGEANAILTGDALLSMAFYLIGKIKNPRLTQAVLLEISRAIGSFGMVGGQVADIDAKNKKVGLPMMEYINTHKTGSLIAVSAKIGGMIAGAGYNKINALKKYGEYVGLAFQVVDDAMDRDGYADIFGVRGARNQAQRLVKRAKEALSIFGKRAGALNAIADFVYERKY